MIAVASNRPAVELASADCIGVEIKDNLVPLAVQTAGADVADKVNLGGTNVARAALESGDIDVYMEYNGTGYSVHLAIEDEIPFDPEEWETNTDPMSSPGGLVPPILKIVLPG